MRGGLPATHPRVRRRGGVPFCLRRLPPRPIGVNAWSGGLPAGSAQVWVMPRLSRPSPRRSRRSRAARGPRSPRCGRPTPAGQEWRRTYRTATSAFARVAGRRSSSSAAEILDEHAVASAALRASDSSRSIASTASHAWRTCRARRVTAAIAPSVEERRGAGRRGEHVVDARQDGFVRGIASHRPQDVEDTHVLAAFPDRMALRVAEQPRETPVLAVAVAAVELDRRARGLDAETAESRLGRGDEDPAQPIAVGPRATRARTRTRARVPLRARPAGRRAARARGAGRRGAGPARGGGAPRSPLRGRSGGRSPTPSSPHRIASR